MTALYNDIEIVDIMKTFDNRYVMKEEDIAQAKENVPAGLKENA